MNLKSMVLRNKIYHLDAASELPAAEQGVLSEYRSKSMSGKRQQMIERRWKNA